MTTAAAPAPTSPRRLDEAVARVREAAPRWAGAPAAERIALARALLAGMARNAERIVRAGCVAKGLAPGSFSSGDEWTAGVYPAIRMLRELVRSLSALSEKGNTPLGPVRETIDGRAAAHVFPSAAADSVFFPGVRAEVHFVEGVGPREIEERRARFHKAPDHAGRVCLVLGAGNVNSITPMDVATKLFNEGKVCVLKMNPVNAYVGPMLEDAFADAIVRGYVAVVYGGPEEGAYLAQHPGVDEVHLTGSNATHDAIVWGPPGPERAARMARGEPRLRKEITSELGDVSPVLVVPGAWDGASLRFQAESVAGMVTQNGSFNCAAARLLVLPRGWRLRDAFLQHVERFLGETPPRPGWYPGASDRLEAFVAGRPHVRKVEGHAGTLPWTLVTGLDAGTDDPAFTSEAFCSVLAETSVGSEDPLEYLDAAVRFANERVWGTLSAQILAPASTLADPVTGAAVQRAIRRLEYGTVALNCFSAYGFALATPPWGGFPGRPLHDVRSGRGFVHNTLMLEDVEKTVVTHPVTSPVKPVYFPSHRTQHLLGPRLVALEGRGHWWTAPSIMWAGLRG
jgi:acyl-CoA reductase-like NAD-dependent aldehyde dehydrogenase